MNIADIELKEDSQERLAAIEGEPTKHYVFANEFNALVEASKHFNPFEIIMPFVLEESNGTLKLIDNTTYPLYIVTELCVFLIEGYKSDINYQAILYDDFHDEDIIMLESDDGLPRFKILQNPWIASDNILRGTKGNAFLSIFSNVKEGIVIKGFAKILVLPTINDNLNLIEHEIIAHNKPLGLNHTKDIANSGDMV